MITVDRLEKLYPPVPEDTNTAKFDRLYALTPKFCRETLTKVIFDMQGTPTPTRFEYDPEYVDIGIQLRAFETPHGKLLLTVRDSRKQQWLMVMKQIAMTMVEFLEVKGVPEPEIKALQKINPSTRDYFDRVQSLIKDYLPKTYHGLQSWVGNMAKIK